MRFRCKSPVTLVETGMSGNLLKADFESDGPPSENLRVEIERPIRNVSPSFPTYNSYAKTDEPSRGKGSSFPLPIVKLAEAACDKLLRIFDRCVRNQRAVGMRVPANQQRYSLFQLAAKEQHDLLVR
jgi:hypothetical protein